MPPEDDGHETRSPFSTAYFGPLSRNEIAKTDFISRLIILSSVSSHYDAFDRPVTVAKVDAPQAWRKWVVKAAREGQIDSFQKDVPHPDPDYGACAEIAPAFLEAMDLIVDETARVLSWPPQIGFLVLPHNLFFYSLLVDDLVHVRYDCYLNPQRGYLIEFDIVHYLNAARYGYRLITSDDLDVPWAPGGRELWDRFGDTVHDEIFADPDIYVVMANFERDYLELALFCVTHGPASVSYVFGLGEDSLEDRPADDVSQVQAPSSREHGRATEKLAAGTTAFLDEVSPLEQIQRIVAVVVTGSASEAAINALGCALRKALPSVDSARFHDSLDPAAVFSLGAATTSRNFRLIDERHGCEWDVWERLRQPQGLPLDEEFPCNRSWIPGAGRY